LFLLDCCFDKLSYVGSTWCLASWHLSLLGTSSC